MSNKNIFQVSEKIIEIAKNITKARNESDAIARLKEDKNMLLLFQKAVLAAECEIDVAVIKDKESARTRDIAIIDSGRKNMRADIMVIAAAIGLFICLTAIVLYRNDLPGEAVGIISTIAGIFGSCLKDAYNFEFGSSRGSKEKDRTVAAMLNRRDV
jgi:hypothetical protein